MEVLLFALWHGLGITLGYHRLLSHRSFKCVKWLEYALVLGGYLAFQGAPIWWVAKHRTHHRFVDTELDTHSPKNGIWQAFAGWIPKGYGEYEDPKFTCKDLYADPVYRNLGSDHRHVICLSLCVLFRGALWLISPDLAAASLLAWLIVWLIPMVLNVVCHIRCLGYRTYDTKDNSVNNWFLGVLGVGEGFHNNHHETPGAAQIGKEWFEIDLGWIALKLFALMGWAHLR